MDLVSLIAACTIGSYAPDTIEALVTLASRGEPWSYRVEGEANPQVFKTVEAAMAGARQAQADGRAVRVGLAGIEVDLEAGTAQPNEAMWAPCVNINIATRRLAAAQERCAEAGRSAPELCAVGVYWGSWEKPDLEFMDNVLIQMAVLANQPSAEVADYELEGSTAEWSAPAALAVPAPVSEEEKERQVFLEGGGSLFPKEAAADKDLSEDPARMMIFQPGAGFERQGEETESEAATSLKGEGVPSH